MHSFLEEFYREIGLEFKKLSWLKKQYGQHLLIDTNVLEKILHTASPLGDIVEVGPGPGILTLELLRHAARSVRSFEIDHRFADSLAAISNMHTNFTSSFCDAMGVDWKNILPGADIVSNLPYNIATPLIIKWLRCYGWGRATVMVQKEIADRITAPVGSRLYGRLSAIVQRHANAELLFSVPPDSFFPPPKVWSAVIRITHKSEVSWDQIFDDGLRRIFSNPRKCIRKILPDERWEAIGIIPGKRPCELSVEELEVLSHEIIRF